MVKESLLINRRFVLNPSTHLLADTESENEVRLEPRMVEVLCRLLETPGQTITREVLVTQVWKDYGGGDEGLTQAISGLRRHLRDDKKEVIQTIPKKGYVFRGEVAPASPLATPWRKKQGFLRTGLILVCVLIVAGGIVYKWVASAELKTAYTPGTIPTSGSEEQLREENDRNTIVAISADSTHYKLVVIDDRPPKFYINNRLIPIGQWEPHQELINSLKRQLQEKNGRR